MNVTRSQDPFESLLLVATLCYLDGQCNVVDILKEGEGIFVKGRDGIVSDLKYAVKLLDNLSNKDQDDLLDMKEDMKSWISYLTSEYKSEGKILTLKPRSLTNEDAEKLSEDIAQWLVKIVDSSSKRNTKLIKDVSIEKFFSVSQIKKLDKGIRQDLKDGFDLIGSDSSTAAVMILLRAAEGIIKNYHKQISGIETSRARLNDIIDELENEYKVNKTLVNYLHYIRGKRNDAAHSGKRFSQEDSEKVLVHIKDLLYEIGSNKH